ncbi:ATP-grasp domain-containing protein [Bremerella sp. P1]|uniref:ATP-grasp domain-containing protein n=1 Tax=Bremerella sp. P1 TaxID=3026424 RepID=UPI002368EBDB|nr:ATP-grasp domain-containing protein [Bremerella sp. P1]WDI42221.1 ATP-grasp domain-containing protein [Bremerella sp. P1]
MAELLLVDDLLWVWTNPIGVGIYDFDFRNFFPCRQPWQRPQELTAVGRCGALEDYSTEYDNLRDEGVRLIHTPQQHEIASELAQWYPLIEGRTPRSKVYQDAPSGQAVAETFQFPVFVKGSRQTSRHQKSLSIANSPEEFEQLMARYASDPILNWQSVVVREFVPLRHVEKNAQGKIDSSFEFRTFWWKRQFVGAGRYWWEGRAYQWSDVEKSEALTLAESVACLIDVPFLVIDLSMTADGEWIVIECNDGQESGYAGVSPISLWQNILEIERS